MIELGAPAPERSASPRRPTGVARAADLAIPSPGLSLAEFSATAFLFSAAFLGGGAFADRAPSAAPPSHSVVDFPRAKNFPRALPAAASTNPRIAGVAATSAAADAGRLRAFEERLDAGQRALDAYRASDQGRWSIGQGRALDKPAELRRYSAALRDSRPDEALVRAAAAPRVNEAR